MTHDASPLMRFYDGWGQYQELLVGVIAPLTDDQLAVRATVELRQLWEIAAHIVAARAYWFHRVMGEGSVELVPLLSWDDEGMPRRNTEQLVRGLNETWAMIEECLRRWIAADLDMTYTVGDGSRVSRQWVIWHVIEHDVHHGGEISLLLGMNGLRAPDL